MHQKKTLNVLFLGASKRLSLLEYFQDAASAEQIAINMYSVELTRRVPIAKVAQIIEGPSFKDGEAERFLIEVASSLQIDIVIPNVDPATVLLSRMKKELAEGGTWAVVSRSDLCTSMYDKTKADEWFRQHGCDVPGDRSFPKIAKLRLGSGSKEQFVVSDENELTAAFKSRNSHQFFLQSFVRGQEYTVDAYVTRNGKLAGSLSRKRLEVSDGEVEVSETFRHERILNCTASILSSGGWEGPITLQFIDGESGLKLIEINPRFGGGATHAIHCGLDMPRWVLRECMELPIDGNVHWSNGSLMTRCRRDIFFDNPS